jgi:hypothetical protein
VGDAMTDEFGTDLDDRDINDGDQQELPPVQVPSTPRPLARCFTTVDASTLPKGFGRKLVPDWSEQQGRTVLVGSHPWSSLGGNQTGFPVVVSELALPRSMTTPGEIISGKFFCSVALSRTKFLTDWIRCRRASLVN